VNSLLTSISCLNMWGRSGSASLKKNDSTRHALQQDQVTLIIICKNHQRQHIHATRAAPSHTRPRNKRVTHNTAHEIMGCTDRVNTTHVSIQCSIGIVTRLLHGTRRAAALSSASWSAIAIGLVRLEVFEDGIEFHVGDIVCLILLPDIDFRFESSLGGSEGHFQSRRRSLIGTVRHRDECLHCAGF